ncbi:MAG: hypothetical protein LIP23_08400, partial [Planctomycetes bacterium]|nr:hypothetical protein [Planctomycetota bacterium]
MTAKNNLATLYDAYNSLTVADQTVLQALSVLYHPASAVLTASCLGAAGCRESHLRAFSPQNVAVRLARLTKAGLTRESVSEGKNSTKLWNCKNGIGEIAIRHAIRDGRFMPLAKAALAETRGRDWRGDGADDSPLRRLRIHFHVGNFDGVERDFAALAEEEPGQGARFLGQLISLQPDDSWRQNADNKSLAPMTAAALADAVKGLVNPGPIESLAKELLAGKNPDPVLDPVAAGLADIAALQGKPNSVSKLADYAAREETRLAIKLGAAMVEADADTLDLAETALASRRSRLGGREHLLPGLAGVWHALAVSVADSPDAVGTMMKRIASPAGRNHEHAAALACIGYALQFLEGQSHSARAIPDFPPADDAITALCHALAMLRIEPGRAKDLVEELKDQAARARAGGYRWLAAQLAAVCEATQGGYDPAAAASAWKPLAAAFISHDEWRRSLKALDELAVETPTAEPAPKKRLAWLVNQADHPANPFAPLTLQPVEQSIGKDGQWSKGRNIALRRIYQRASDVDAATMQDRRLFMALDIEYDGMGQGYRFNVDDALPDLVGHPLVFRGDSGGAKLEVVAGDLELSVGDREGGCEIGLEPALTDFFAGDPDEDEPDRHIDLPDTAARFETPTRLRVYRFGEKEKKLIQAIGDGLTVPASGRSEALRTLSNLAGRVRLHSELRE